MKEVSLTPSLMFARTQEWTGFRVLLNVLDQQGGFGSCLSCHDRPCGFKDA